MLEAARTLLLTVSALFSIVNPPGGSPIFLARTAGYPPDARKALAQQVALNSFFVLVVSYFIGTYILQFFGISLPVVLVGGGFIVISIGWTMLKQGGEDEPELQHDMQPQDLYRQAFYPLTLPLTVGPGSISVAITLGANAARRHTLHPLTILTAVVGFALIACSIFLCYGFADRLARTLGGTGMTVVTKLSSFLLVCIGVQIVWNGIRELLESVVLHLAS